MAWTATLTAVRLDGIDLHLSIEITDGTNTIKMAKSYAINDAKLANFDDLKADIAARAAGLPKLAFAQNYVGQVIHSGT